MQKQKLSEKTAIKSSWVFLLKLIGCRYHRHVYFFYLQNKIKTVVSHRMILVRITNRLQGKSQIWSIHYSKIKVNIELISIYVQQKKLRNN